MWNPQSIYNQVLLRTPAIVTGRESIRGLYNYPCARIAVIRGASFKDNDLLKETFKKKDIKFFKRSWSGEPDLEGLSGTLRELEEYKPDTIIAVGGGSVIDGSKLCRLFLEFPFYKFGVNRLDGSAFTTKFIVVPTTIGSGAEVSSAAVYFDQESRSKQMIVMHEFQPDVIVYDDYYVKGASIKLFCASALDAFAHIIEGYVSKVENSMAETLAEAGLFILRNEIGKILDVECANIRELDNLNFDRLQYAGYLGGLVQNHCIVGAAHAVAHQLTQSGFSHGEAVGLLLSHVMRLNLEDKSVAGKYERLAERSGFNDAEDMIKLIEALSLSSRFYFRRRELHEILEKSMSDETFVSNIKNDRGGRGNPVEINDDYIARLSRRI